MSRRSRRSGRRSSRRNLWLTIAVVAIVATSAVGYYVVDLRSPAATASTSTTSTTSTSSLGPYAVLQTSQGTIVIQLFPALTPQTVANFEKLANTGFYTDLVWHRIVQGFVIQTGDPTTRNGGGNESQWGEGGSGTTIPFENDSIIAAEEGTVAMANTSPGGAGASSQFFININNNTSLTGQYAIFGRVVMGLNVALDLGNVPVNPQCQSSGDTDCQPLEPDQAMLFSVTIQTTP